MTARHPRPLPWVRDRIRLWYPGTNVNTWPGWAEVRARIDERVFVVHRPWVKHREPYLLISGLTWDVFGEAYRHRCNGRIVGLDGKPCSKYPERTP